MSAAFTPGPWTTEPGVFWICDVGNNIDDPGVWSAYPVKPGEDFPFGDKQADAHLIAAAPELYETLDKLIATDAILSRSQATRVRALLAKARGEA